MSLRQLNIAFPEKLYRELQSLVPAGERTRFLTQLTENGLRHLKLEKALRRSYGAWRKESHPELKSGVHAYVKRLRKGRHV